MRITHLIVLAALTLPLPALAQEAVALPKPRPVESSEAAKPPAPEPAPPVESSEEPEPAATPPAEPTTPLPRRRPDPKAPTVEDKAAPEAEKGEVPAAERTQPAKPEPEPAEPPEPPRIYQSACPAVVSGQVEATMQPPISEGQCHAQSPLALTGVMANGRMVPVTGGVVTSCNMASTLPGWVASVDNYLFAKENTRIAEVTVSTSYMCRNVNNATSGNLSFHGFADAVDVMGFKLEDGRTVTVEGGWRDALSNEGRLLRFAHDSACSMFSTTLGPEANAEHADHLHLDMGCHGGRCVARLCE